MATSRRWLQFSLRGFLVVLTIGCLWLGWEVERVQRRLRALDAIVIAAGGQIGYDGLSNAQQSHHLRNAIRRIPVHIWLAGPLNADLATHLSHIHEIKCLTLAAEATDIDLEYLGALDGACEIQLNQAERISQAALDRLKERFPNTEIWITTSTRHVRYERRPPHRTQ